MNISLIGMMGSGKTTIAQLLVHKFPSYTFVDTDSLIVKEENMSINQIFEIKGEAYFRTIESNILEKILSSDNQIISTGGGIVKNPKNILNLKDSSLVFYLSADVDTLYERVKNNSERPLLNTEDMYNKIKLLLEQRIPLYQKAHYVIDTASKTPDIIVDEIIEKLSNYAKS